MRMLRLGLGLAAGLVVLVAGCSDDDSETPVTTSSPAVSSSAPASRGAPASNVVVDIVECDNAGGTVTSSGTLLNGGEESTSFVLEIGVHDLDTDELLGTDTVEIEPVAPGDEAEWSIEVSGAGSAEVTCRTANVTEGTD
jgi:hypothetical protein